MALEMCISIRVAPRSMAGPEPIAVVAEPVVEPASVAAFLEQHELQRYASYCAIGGVRTCVRRGIHRRVAVDLAVYLPVL